MNLIQTAVRRVLGNPYRLSAAGLLKGRLMLVFALLATTLGSAFGPLASVGLASDPVGRFQLVVKDVLVHDDHEGALSGKGDMKLNVSVILCPDSIPSPCFFEGEQVGAMVRATTTFQGGTGETVALNRVVPDDGDQTVGGDITPELGFYAVAGYYHLIRFDMTETDSVTNHEPMGWVIHVVETARNGAGIGTFTARSLTHQGARQGDYTITFEVRPIPLPDVRPARIEISDLPNSSKKRVCTVVQNVGAADAGPFMVALYIDGSDSEGGKPVIASLARGAVSSACVDTALPATGQYLLRAALDEPRRLTEFNEGNNVLLLTQTATPKQAQPDSPPAATSVRADLSVAAIRVNGRVPDGKNRCKDGKNLVGVVVKNVGMADAGEFTVRLVVDGGESAEKVVGNLGTGEEQEIRFADVRLKKGEHTLTARADGDGEVVEAREGTNERTVTATCSGDA